MLYSSEGTTQGDPLAMPMYAIATIPLINKLHCNVDDVKQAWYANDASAAGKITRLREWWSHLSSHDPKFGYYANANKTWLVTKGKHLAAATASFADTGAVIGSEEFVLSHVEDRVGNWKEELQRLVTIALTLPHAAHAALLMACQANGPTYNENNPQHCTPSSTTGSHSKVKTHPSTHWSTTS